MSFDAPTHRVQVIGRDAELSRIEAFLDAIVDGPAALVLEGESGMGKSTLWNGCLADARAREWRVLSIRPVEAEARLSFAGLADLLEGTRDVFEALPGPLSAGLEVALLRAEPTGPPPEPRAVFAAVLAVLRETSARDPVLVAIDDVQWLDGATADALRFAIRRLQDESIGLLLAVRGTGDGLPLDVAHGIRDERVTRLAVEPLYEDDLAELLRVRLDATLPRPSFKALCEMSGGNPFFALEIARAALQGDRRATGLTLPVPRNLRDDLVRDRLGTLQSSVQEALLFAAACSRPTVQMLEAATGVSPLEPKLVKAVAAGIVDIDDGMIRFTHPLYGSAIYAEASREHRHRVHRRLSEVIDDPEERARHLALAASGPDAVASEALEQAATRARARGSPAAAAELCGLAERLAPADDDGQRRLRAARAEYQLAAGDAASALELLGWVADASPAGPERAAALLRWARALASTDDLRGAVDALSSALREERTDRSTRSSILALRSHVLASCGDLPSALEDAEEAVRLAERAAPPTVAAALMALLSVRGWLGRKIPRDRMRRVLQLEGSFEPASVADRPTFVLAQVLVRTGNLDEGRRICDGLLEAANLIGDEDSAAILHAELANVELLSGAWRQALGHCVSAAALAPRRSVLGVRALAEAHLGEVDTARADASGALADLQRSGRVEEELLAHSALGALELSLGNPSDARVHLGRAWELHRRWGIGEPAAFPFVADHVECLLELGEVEAAYEIVRWLGERGRALDRAWALAVASRYRAILAAAGGDFPSAFADLEIALHEQERIPSPFERGRTLLTLGSVRRRARQKRPAREALDEALEIFESLGARLWADRTRSELARIGGRRAVLGELTEAERRVADLAAAGRTNREIADTLFMSVRTVEGHLSHAYAKLGIRSRTELALFVDESQRSPDP